MSEHNRQKSLILLQSLFFIISRMIADQKPSNHMARKTSTKDRHPSSAPTTTAHLRKKNQCFISDVLRLESAQILLQPVPSQS